MTRVDLPGPVVGPSGSDDGLDLGTLERELRVSVDGEVRFDAGSRAAYSTDASNYRQVPIGVVVPRTVDAAAQAVRVCRTYDVPVLARGGATSLAGQCTNTAVIIDFSKYCTRLLSVDEDSRTCWVEPGIVLDDLNEQLSRYGLQFGPQPATHTHCTLGGMLGNNSCGATAQRTGKVVDNTVSLEVLLYDDTRMEVGQTSDERYAAVLRAGGREAEVYRQLRELRDACADAVRREYPDIPRRVSGYNLDSLLPEQDFHLAQALVGSESTCVLVLRAQLRLMPVVAARSSVLLGYRDVGSSGDDVPAVLRHQPIALEGFDTKVISYQRSKQMNPAAIELLPEGPQAWLLVQFGADSAQEARNAATGLSAAAKQFPSEPTVTVFDEDAEQEQIWSVREAALGATAQVPGLAAMWPGWEDSAVAPEQMGTYLRALGELYAEFGYSDASLYGHYGQGCVHTRIPFELSTAEGIAQFRLFMVRAARLVVSLGGSLSGEHGDGQSRAELLPIMYSAELIRAFAQFKAIFDPDNRMNPGKLTRPHAIDEKLRLGADYAPRQPQTYFAFPNDEGRFDRAALRCVGVGKCRRQQGGVMCPSYMVTKEEEHSTRGRARVLFEMLQGHPDSPITEGWRSEAVKDALDLCLACKGCKKDCPVNVDMATYKAEFLAHHYAGRLRPLAHYSMGWLPALARVGSRLPRVVNALTQAPGLSRLATLAAGVAAERAIPEFAEQSFQHWYAERGPARQRAAG